MSDPVTVVAVDGPSASGKSTVSRLVARELGFNYVDSGAMYRAVTWKAVGDGVDVNDLVSVLALLKRIRIEFEVVDREARILIDGVHPGEELRRPEVADRVSVIAAIPEVRGVLVGHQRALTRFGSLVMEGRDIGSVVFPHTPHKFYIDARASERAKRRQQDFAAMKVDTDAASVAAALARRDQLDSQRAVAPLQIALGATVIDNSQNTAEQTARIIVDRIRQHGTRRGAATVGG
ncbi:(d)CMP kinase [bacterium]|nr:(d)CMP kinase [bacterium]